MGMDENAAIGSVTCELCGDGPFITTTGLARHLDLECPNRNLRRQAKAPIIVGTAGGSINVQPHGATPWEDKEGGGRVYDPKDPGRAREPYEDAPKSDEERIAEIERDAAARIAAIRGDQGGE